MFAATACAVSRDMRWGQIFSTYLKSLTPICLFTMQLSWRYTLQWRLRAVYSVHVECCLSCIRAKISISRLSAVDIGPPNGVFWRKGSVNVKFWFKKHILAQNLVFGARSRACAETKRNPYLIYVKLRRMVDIADNIINQSLVQILSTIG